MTSKSAMLSKARVTIVLTLFAITWYLLQMTSGVKAVPIKQTLSHFPHQLGSYRLANSFQSSADVLEMLGVDDYIQYNYIDETTSRVNLYVGYYKAVGVSGGYHSPKNCLPGGGWGIDEVKKVVLPVGIEGNKEATVSQMLIRNGAEYQIVLYWYQNRGRVIASEYWEKIYLVQDALLQGRRDGSFVRIMATVKGNDFAGAEEQVKEFAQQVIVSLEKYLPGSRI